MNVTCLNGNVLVIGDADSERPNGLIITPQTSRDRDIPSTGVVAAVGGARITKKGVRVEPEFKVGDKIVFRKFCGLLVDIRGKRFIQIKQHDVEAILL